MNSVYSTGNSIVDENARVNISGNIIPQTWYKTIIKDNGKPYLTAIVILSDIVYCYKPTEIRAQLAEGEIVTAGVAISRSASVGLTVGKVEK